MAAGTGLIPESIRSLFWDAAPDSVDLERHADYVIERVLELGRPEACRWLMESLGRDRVVVFLRDRGPRRLSPRALNFWALLLGVEDRECLLKSSLADRSPLWRP